MFIFIAKETHLLNCRNWAQYYPGKAKFLPENIDATLCSVINYASMQINFYNYRMEGRQKNDDEMIKRIIALKKLNPKLQVFISIGRQI